MRYTVLFSNLDCDCCLVEHMPNGSKRNILFENTSSLVNFCKTMGTPVTLEDCKPANDFSFAVI